jgi:hypothetical protein
MPIINGLLPNADDLPHTISSAVLYRLKIDSFNELPKDKRPPRDLWGKPYKLEKFLDSVFDTKSEKETEFIDFDEDDIE